MRTLERHGLPPLQAYRMRAGLPLLRRGRLKRSLRYLVVPVNYWRAAEFELALEGDFRPGARVLDVGSPKLLSLLLAEKAGVRMVATDIEDYFIPEYEHLPEIRGLGPDRLSLNRQRHMSGSATAGVPRRRPLPKQFLTRIPAQVSDLAPRRPRGVPDRRGGRPGGHALTPGNRPIPASKRWLWSGR